MTHRGLGECLNAERRCPQLSLVAVRRIPDTRLASLRSPKRAGTRRLLAPLPGDACPWGLAVLWQCEKLRTADAGWVLKMSGAPRGLGDAPLEEARPEIHTRPTIFTNGYRSVTTEPGGRRSLTRGRTTKKGA